MSLLLSFDAAARHLSFSRAADELSLTQSVVSRQVQSLEELLGVSLFRRDGRRIVLTDVGRLYQSGLEPALHRIRNTSLQAMAYRIGGGSLHLATLPTFAAKWLMPRLNGFYAQHPDILVHVHSRIGRFDLDLAGIDVVIGVDEGGADRMWSGLVEHHLRDETVVPVISPALARSHPLRDAGDLAQHLLLQVASRANAWPRWFAAHGEPSHKIRLGPQFELTSHLIQAVATGIGVGLVPDFLIEEELRSGVLERALDLPLDTGAKYYLFVPQDKLKLPPIAAFTQWILQIK